MRNTLLFRFFITLVFILMIYKPSCTQDADLLIPPDLSHAYDKGTRSLSGKPGEKYWQNKANYDLRVQFDPNTRTVAGTGTINYFNNSPDTLDQLLLLLLADLYKQGNPRDLNVSAEDEHPGVLIRELRIGDHFIDTKRGKNRDLIHSTTSAWLLLPAPLLPGSSLTLEVSWEYPLNSGSHMRTGQVDESSFFLAYWFPRIGVYDDVTGWNDFAYTGVGEFYNDFGDFNVEITVPPDFMVWATGELQNPETVFPDHILKRYQNARQSSAVIRIIDISDLDNRPGRESSFNVWNYRAENVTDFAFALSDHYLWDGYTLPAGSDGAPVFISTVYNPASNDFYQLVDMASRVITYMTTKLPGLPFPFPSITIFNGLDEMEYPMMVNNHSFTDLDETFKLTAHEVAHSYFPFYTGCNESKYAWMDEGLTSLFEYHMTRDLVDSSKAYVYFTREYMEMQGTERDIPLMTASDLVRAPEYYAIYYAKAVFFYSVFLDQVGEDAFRDILAEFVDRWAGKHPTGYDFIFTVRDVYGEDLTWLFQPWFFEFGFVDLGIAGVEKTGSGIDVEVESIGTRPAPVHLLVTFQDGSSTLFSRPPELWKNNKTSVTIEISDSREIKQLELIQEFPMDVNRENDVYRF